MLDSAPVAHPETEQAKVRAGVTGELPSTIRPAAGSAPAARWLRRSAPRSNPPTRTFPGSGHLAACRFPLQPVMADSAASVAQQP
jgi:hypothetical protein